MFSNLLYGTSSVSPDLSSSTSQIPFSSQKTFDNSNVFPNEIINGLYVGNYLSAEHISQIFDLVINCTTHIPFFQIPPEKQIRIPVCDTPDDSQKMLYYLDIYNVFDKIHRVIKNGGKVLIHCHMGMQRSAAVAAAYLIYVYGIPIDAAISRVKKSRPMAFFTGVNFIDTLKEIYKIYGKFGY